MGNLQTADHIYCFSEQMKERIGEWQPVGGSCSVLLGWEEVTRAQYKTTVCQLGFGQEKQIDYTLKSEN